MKNVIIVGKGGFSRECYSILQIVMQYNRELQFAGFLAYNCDEWDSERLHDKFLGNSSDYDFSITDHVVLAIGDNELREAAYHHLKERNCSFMNLIHPFSYIDPSAILGEGNILGAGSSISCDVKMGNCNILNGTVIVGHDAVLGDFNFCGPFVQLLGYTVMGDKNDLAVSSIMLPKTSIGNANSISPASVVYTRFQNNCRIHGNPALKIGSYKNE